MVVGTFRSPTRIPVLSLALSRLPSTGLPGFVAPSVLLLLLLVAFALALVVVLRLALALLATPARFGSVSGFAALATAVLLLAILSIGAVPLLKTVAQLLFLGPCAGPLMHLFGSASVAPRL